MLNELLGAVCVFGIALTLVTVIGHGLWLLIGALGRLMSGSQSPTSDDRPRCASCGYLISSTARPCPRCGHVTAQAKPPAPGDDLTGLIERLSALSAEGVVPPELYEAVATVLREHQEHQQRVLAAPTAPHVAAASQIIDAVVVAEAVEHPAPPVLQPSPRAAEAVTPFGPLPGAPKPHPLDAEAPLPAPTTQARQTLADFLQAFMAEKNIRWGELVSGLLIVGSAVGLVISLRETLREAIPYFPALLFMLVTLAIYGAGMYTLQRWNLRATSRGVLTISLLLAPLNFLAAIILSEGDQRPVTDLWYLTAMAVGTACCGWITFSAGRALLGRGWWRLTAAMLATSCGQLLIDRRSDLGASLLGTAALTVLPVGGYLAATLSQLHGAIAWRRISERRAVQILLVLGLSTFALILPLALLVAHRPELHATLARLTPALSLVAAAVLGTGLALHGRVLSRALAAYRTTGTALAVAGGMLTAIALVLAWPEPELLITGGLTDFTVLVAVAVIGRLPLLHLAACVCLTLAYLVGFHLIQGNWTSDAANPSLQWLRLFLMGRSGLALTGLAAAVGGVAAWLGARRRPREALYYALAAGGLAAASIAIGLIAGFGPSGDRDLSALILAIYAIPTVIAATQLGVRDARVAGPARWLTYAGATLTLATLVQAGWMNESVRDWLSQIHLLPPRPVLTAALVTANGFALLALWFARGQLGVPTIDRVQPRWPGLVQPLLQSALVIATLAAPSALWAREEAFGVHALYIGGVALVWLIATLIERQWWALVVFQVLATFAVGFATAATCRNSEQDDWLVRSPHLQTQFAVLAVWCLGWSVSRWQRWIGASARWPMLSVDTRSAVTVDQVLLAGLVAGALWHGVAACWPGLLAELGIARLAADEVPRLVCGPAAWCALLLILAALIVSLREQAAHSNLDPFLRLYTLAGVWVALAAVPCLVSAPWFHAGATASAWRWSFAFYAAAVSTVIWFRRQLVPWMPDTTARLLRELGLWIGVAPVVLLTTVVVARSVVGDPIGKPDPDCFFGHLTKTISYGVPLLIAVAVLLGHAAREGISGYALLSSVIFQYSLTLAHAIHTKVNQPGYAAELLQWNATGLAAFTMLWLFLHRWLRPHGERQAVRPPVPAAPASTPTRLSPGEREAVRPPVPAAASPSARLRAAEIPLQVQLGATFLAVAALAVWAAGAVFVVPGALSEHERPLGGALSYVAWGLAAMVGVWFSARRPIRIDVPPGETTFLTGLTLRLTGQRAVHLALRPGHILDVGAGGRVGSESQPTLRSGGVPSETGAIDIDLPQAVAGCAMALVALLAMTLDRWSAGHPWLAYHVLTYGWLLLAAALVAATCCRLYVWREATLVGCFVVVLAIRGCLPDPHPGAPWWSIGAAAGTALLAAVMAVRRRRQAYAYGMVLLTVLATSFYWFGPWLGRWPQKPFERVIDLVLADLTALTWASLLWLAVELWFQRRSVEGTFDPRRRVGRVHTVLGLLALAAAVLPVVLVFLGNCANHPGTRIELGPGNGLPVVIGLGLLLAGAFWDRLAVHAIPGLYVWGALAIVLVLDKLGLPPKQAFHAVGLALAGYVTLTSLLWQRGAWWAWLGDRWGVPDPVAGLRRTARWLPLVNLLVTLPALAFTLIVVLWYDARWMRISSGFGPAILAVGLGALAQKERRGLLQYVSLLMTGIAAVYVSWADLPPHWDQTTWLLRVIRLLIVACAMTFLYGVLVRRRLSAEGDWLRPVRRITVTFGGAALVTLALVLLIEFLAFDPTRGVGIDPVHLAAVAVVLVGLIAGLISLAVWPDRDPLALSETGRTAYVYAAETVAALLFVHVYLSMPWLFHGRIRQYWPYVVMAIAFGGVGAGELLQRRGIRVLAEPLRRTGAFLPLLPALGMWVVAAERTNYSALLFVVGILYLLLALTRRSALCAAAAVVAGNGALWSLLRQTDFAFWQHPQLWLIPPAASALIAGQLNRRRLPPVQLTGLRYASVLLIYLSSTSEMFIRGIGESLWPPMILATLSVAGVFLGMVLQIRAFLYLGSSFVLLAIVSMVWHASRAIQHSWPWWAFCMGLGLSILALFGVFEKKRPEVMAWIQKLRQWEQ